MDKYEKDTTELDKSQKAYQDLQCYRKNSSFGMYADRKQE